MLRTSSRPCAIHRDHSPNPQRTHLHHIIPKSFGGGDEPENIIPLCSTAHDNLHVLLALYVKTGGKPFERIDLRTFGYRERELAKRGWEGRLRTRFQGDSLPEPLVEED